MNINQQTQELLLKVTSIITCTYPNTDPKQATCFFCQKTDGKVILVTNKHVFENALTANLYLTVHNTDANIFENKNIKLNLGNDIKHHQNYDVSMLDFTDINETLKSKNIVPQIAVIKESGIITNYDNMEFIQEILMIGYPDGIIDSSTNNPVIRTGVTATPIKHKYNNQETFLTDLPTFWGSSGSPILIAEDGGSVKLVGVAYRTELNERPVYDKKYGSPNRNIIGYVQIPNDIGRAVNSKIIKEMLDSY